MCDNILHKSDRKEFSLEDIKGHQAKWYIKSNNSELGTYNNNAS